MPSIDGSPCRRRTAVAQAEEARSWKGMDVSDCTDLKNNEILYLEGPFLPAPSMVLLATRGEVVVWNETRGQGERGIPGLAVRLSGASLFKHSMHRKIRRVLSMRTR